MSAKAAREFLVSVLEESNADEADGGAGWDVEVDARTVLDVLQEGRSAMAIDKERLEEFLKAMAAEARPLRGAIYDGLLARVRRGDFDEEQEQ